MQKSISFVGTVGLPAKYGGFETLVEQLCLHLQNEYTIWVYCSSKHYENKNKYLGKVRRVFIPLKANGAQSILYDLIGIIMALYRTDIVVVLGGSAGFFIPLAKLFFIRKKIIFHPDGMEWKRKKWNSFASFYLWISIKTACFASDKIIIDNKVLLNNYLPYKRKIIEISYGGDQYKNLNSSAQQKSWLTIARAEQENNLLLIAKAFANVPEENWILVSNASTTKFGKQLIKYCRNFNNIKLMPQTYKPEIIEQYYQECKGYIHGHMAGGTNPSLTVAMWLNKPLLCHGNEFNKITTNKFAWFFNNTAELVQLIKKDSSELEKFQQQAKFLAGKQYTWRKISDSYKEVFESF